MKNEMARVFFYALLLIGFSGCNFPTELPIGEKEKAADNFARHFISNIITGQIDSCFAELSAELLDDETKLFITNLNRSVAGAAVKKYKVVEDQPTYMIYSPRNEEKFATYKLAYEYEFEKGRILFITTVREKEGKFLITDFRVFPLKASLSEITQFKLSTASNTQLVFVFFAILIPVFILISWMVMLFSNLTIKSKVGWTFLILLVNLPRLTIDGTSGQIGFQLFNITLLGSGFGRAALYYGWSIFFNLPIGAIAFWLRRKKLLKNAPIDNPKDSFDSIEALSVPLQEPEISDHTSYMPK